MFLILSGIAYVFGNLFLEISLITFVSITASIPLGIAHALLYKDSEKNDVVRELEKIINGDQNGS